MFINKFDEAMDDISDEYGVLWNDQSKIAIFARFLEEQKPCLFDDFVFYVNEQAVAEQELAEECEEE